MSQKIFITASTGNIGSQISQNLKAQKIPFTAGVNTAPTNEGAVFLDYDDEESLRKACLNSTSIC